MKQQLKLVVSLLLIVLIAAGTLIGCEDNNDSNDNPGENGENQNLTSEQLTFKFEVIGSDEKATPFDITTTKTTVGDALRENGIIEEEGLINTVNGVTLDWNIDKAYWEFRIDGEYALTGVDDTNIQEGVTYAFVYTPA